MLTSSMTMFSLLINVIVSSTTIRLLYVHIKNTTYLYNADYVTRATPEYCFDHFMSKFAVHIVVKRPAFGRTVPQSFFSSREGVPLEPPLALAFSSLGSPRFVPQTILSRLTCTCI